MQKILRPYEKWECWQKGLYKISCDDWQEKTDFCYQLLSSDELYDSMTYIAENWLNSANHYLKKNAGIYRPWLGHASCLFEFDVPNWVTKKAWNQMGLSDQEKANSIADRVRLEWMSYGKDLFGYRCTESCKTENSLDI